MALTGLDAILGAGKDFIPHIEAAAIRYIERSYVMPSRVASFNDMQGFNPRKVSEYLLPRRAQDLQEATDIPDTNMVRARRAQIDIKEVGDRYPVSDRRAQTDLENILSDVVGALGKAVGDRVEYDLIQTAVGSLIGGTLGGASTDYTIDLPITAQFELKKRRGQGYGGLLHHVIHPFQAREVMKSLIQFGGATAQAALDYRNAAISSWRVPSFDNLEITVSDFLPRRVINRLVISGTGGTFRLSVAGKTTAAITVSATPATMVSNIKTALDNLSIGTWTVAGTDLLDIDVTPPATLYVDADQELAVAVDPANPTLVGQKSAYDLITGGTNVGLDLYGEAYKVRVEEVSATAKSLLFYRDAIAIDYRQAPTAFFELTKQGRVGEYSLYAKYGTGYWRPELGMFIESKANSGFAVP